MSHDPCVTENLRICCAYITVSQFMEVLLNSYIKLTEILSSLAAVAYPCFLNITVHLNF